MRPFTGHLGGRFSEGGYIVLGYDIQDEVVAIWTGLKHNDDGSAEMNFGFDEYGQAVVLRRNVPTILSRAQANQAISNDAALIVIGSLS